MMRSWGALPARRAEGCRRVVERTRGRAVTPRHSPTILIQPSRRPTMRPLLRCVVRCSALVLPALLAGACAARPTTSPALASASATSARYFPPPGDAWERRSPAAVGMDSARLASAVELALASEIPWLRDMQAQVARNTEREPYPDILGPVKDRGGPSGVVL